MKEEGENWGKFPVFPKIRLFYSRPPPIILYHMLIAPS